tara:strand:+ start:1331 stop:1510 length:180 start_codon:yes stop_codon:yes gene_type:complete
MLKNILLYIFLFFGLIFSSCEDDPLLAPQGGDSEDGGSYGNLSLPGEKDKDLSVNPETF